MFFFAILKKCDFLKIMDLPLGSVHILRNQLRGKGGVSQMLMFVDMGGGGC